MSCWEKTFKDIGIRRRLWSRAENERIDRAIEELRRSIMSSPMSGHALTDLLRADVGMSKVRTRVAVDGHDIEVEMQDGLWRVLDPYELKVKELPASSMAHNTSEYVGFTFTTTPTYSSILRSATGQNVRSERPR